MKRERRNGHINLLFAPLKKWSISVRALLCTRRIRAANGNTQQQQQQLSLYVLCVSAQTFAAFNTHTLNFKINRDGGERTRAKRANNRTHTHIMYNNSGRVCVMVEWIGIITVHRVKLAYLYAWVCECVCALFYLSSRIFSHSSIFPCGCCTFRKFRISIASNFHINSSRNFIWKMWKCKNNFHSTKELLNCPKDDTVLSHQQTTVDGWWSE